MSLDSFNLNTIEKQQYRAQALLCMAHESRKLNYENWFQALNKYKSKKDKIWRTCGFICLALEDTNVDKLKKKKKIEELQCPILGIGSGEVLKG